MKKFFQRKDILTAVSIAVGVMMSLMAVACFVAGNHMGFLAFLGVVGAAVVAFRCRGVFEELADAKRRAEDLRQVRSDLDEAHAAVRLAETVAKEHEELGDAARKRADAAEEKLRNMPNADTVRGETLRVVLPILSPTASMPADYATLIRLVHDTAVELRAAFDRVPDLERELRTAREQIGELRQSLREKGPGQPVLPTIEASMAFAAKVAAGVERIVSPEFGELVANIIAVAGNVDSALKAEEAAVEVAREAALAESRRAIDEDDAARLAALEEATKKVETAAGDDEDVRSLWEGRRQQREAEAAGALRRKAAREALQKAQDALASAEQKLRENENDSDADVVAFFRIRRERSQDALATAKEALDQAYQN